MEKKIFIAVMGLVISGCAFTITNNNTDLSLSENPKSYRYVEVEIRVGPWREYSDAMNRSVIYQNWLDLSKLSLNPRQGSQYVCHDENFGIVVELYRAWNEPPSKRYEAIHIWIENMARDNYNETPELNEVYSNFVLNSPGFVILKEEYRGRDDKTYNIMVTKQSEAPPEDQRPTPQKPHKHPSFPEIQIRGLQCSIEPLVY